MGHRRSAKGKALRGGDFLAAFIFLAFSKETTGQILVLPG
jgi:hypothetical protein